MFYVGIKIIEAWPEVKENRKGYSIKHSDGYISWSPKDTFESSYYPMGEKDYDVTEIKYTIKFGLISDLLSNGVNSD